MTALGHGPELGALAASWKTPVAVNAVVPVIQLFAMNSRCSLRCAVHTLNGVPRHDRSETHPQEQRGEGFTQRESWGGRLDVDKTSAPPQSFSGDAARAVRTGAQSARFRRARARRNPAPRLPRCLFFWTCKDARREPSSGDWASVTARLSVLSGQSCALDYRAERTARIRRLRVALRRAGRRLHLHCAPPRAEAGQKRASRAYYQKIIGPTSLCPRHKPRQLRTKKRARG